MLAKVWKKALLAVCIIACIYNVMYKLVSRTSLEVQLKSIQNQTNLTSAGNNEDENAQNSTSNQTKKVHENAENDSIVVIY